jgi:DNA-directed RNA polymerase subunit E"
MTEQACRECHRIVEGLICPTCGSSSLSKDWTGYLVVLDPKGSTLAKTLGITLPGRYALKVR